MSNILVKVDKISKTYGSHKIFENLSFKINKGETFAIIGYSGCGKTTLLRILGGFERADKGNVSIEEQKVTRPSRAAIMVFQDFFQLFPWRTLIDNVVWPMMATGITDQKKEAVEIAEKYLTDMKIDSSDYEKYPIQCSGGMKQRVVLARTLSLKPKVLLMDEPFGALDYLTRQKIQNITKEVSDRYNLTVVLVTHSISEALKMADKILVFHDSNEMDIIQNNDDAEIIIESLLKIENVRLD